MLSTGGTSLSKADTVPDLMELPVSWRESHELCDNWGAEEGICIGSALKKCHLSRSLSWGLKDEEDVGKAEGSRRGCSMCTREEAWGGDRGQVMESPTEDLGFYPQYNEKPLQGFEQGSETRWFVLKRLLWVMCRNWPREQLGWTRRHQL